MKKINMKLVAVVTALAATSAGSASAALITVDTTYGFTTSGLAALTDKSGTDGAGVSASDDPSTWDENGSSFGQMSFDNPLVGASNSKLGWYAFDLGSSQDLGTIYVMNGHYLNGTESLSMDQYNIYYADTPTVALSNGGDYDFSSGGWTQLGGLNTFADQQDTAIATDASGITTRYIGIEMIRDHLTSDVRIGMNEFAVTVPEPSSFALLAGCFGLTWVMLRRRA